MHPFFKKNSSVYIGTLFLPEPSCQYFHYIASLRNHYLVRRILAKLPYHVKIDVLTPNCCRLAKYWRQEPIRRQMSWTIRQSRAIARETVQKK